MKHNRGPSERLIKRQPAPLEERRSMRDEHAVGAGELDGLLGDSRLYEGATRDRQRSDGRATTNCGDTGVDDLDRIVVRRSS